MNERHDRSVDKIKQHWETRASRGLAAGSDDVILKKLEIEAIAKYVKNGMRILEVGCGNGITAVELAKRFNVEIIGIDYVAKMVDEAKLMAARQSLIGKVEFAVGDVCALPEQRCDYDLIYSERVLINLSDFEAQRRAIVDITNLLRPGGRYVMCESCLDGLEKINEMREMIGLSVIAPPWHNIYFRGRDLRELVLPGMELEAVDCFSATYYFLSRVVNAWLAKEEGLEPSYDSTINRLALLLPAFGEMAQARIWLWRKG